MECVRLDSFVSQLDLKRLDFVKIDIEGHEFEALEGMVATLKSYKPILLIEVHPNFLNEEGHSVAKLVNFLVDLGYRIQPVDISKQLLDDQIKNRSEFMNFHIFASHVK